MTLTQNQVKQINDYASTLLEGYDKEPTRNSEGLNIWKRKEISLEELDTLVQNCTPDEYCYDYHFNWIYENLLHLSTCNDPKNVYPEESRPHAYYYNWLSQNNAEYVDAYVQEHEVIPNKFSLIRILENLTFAEECEMYFTVLEYIKDKLQIVEEGAEI